LIRSILLTVTLLAATALCCTGARAQETPATNTGTAYSLQLVPFQDGSEAEAWLARMTRRGYHPYLYEGLDAQGQRWFAVRIDDYATADAARRALADFKRAENTAAFITRRDTIFPDAGGHVAAPLAPPVLTPPAPAPAAAPAAQGDPDLTALKEQLQVLQQKIAELEKEAEARRMLRMTEEEEKERENEILSAAGREYTLIPRHHFNFEYAMSYDYFSSDILEDLRNSEGNRLSAERRGNHTLTSLLSVEYGLLNNLSMNIGLPFVYKYDKRSGDDDREVTDLGDMGLSLQYQPFRADTTWPALIFVLNGTLPTGRSPYKINPDSELATGNGYYALGGGLTFSKTLDPVVAYGSLSYNHPFPNSDTDQLQSNGLELEEVEAGDTIGLSLGMGFALSYRTSLNLSYQYAYHFESRYHFDNDQYVESNSWVTSSFNIGVGWRISPRFSLYTRVDIGLTNDDPDFTFSIRIPVRFGLGD